MNQHSPTDDLLDCQYNNQIATLTFNRPQSRNALSLDMIAALHGAITHASKHKNIKAIIIASKGPAFCAGHDLKEMTSARKQPDNGKKFFAQTMKNCSEMMLAITHSPKPVIAAVDGIATAAGCQLVATCDLAVATESSKFATPGVNIGLFCSTPMVAVSRNIPRKRVMEMLLMGDMIDAQTAAQWGLVNKVVKDGTALEHALAIAQNIAQKSTATIKIGIEAFYNQAEMNLKDAYNYTAQVMTENMLHQDAQEGIDAFIQKRKPKWKE